MSQQQPAAPDPAARLSSLRRLRRWWPWLGAALLVLVVAGLMTSPLIADATAAKSDPHVSGGGRTIIEGGTGGANPVPVVTIVAFYASSQGGTFECLALAPAQATGPGSGEFTVNAMYVTGKVTSLDVSGGTATLRGIATVTGVGAGQDLPFTLWVTAGGPGARVRLDVSGLTFREILLEGEFRID